MKNRTAFLAILAAMMFSGTANSQSPDPGFHSHDGFYLSLSGGFGGMGWKDNEPPGEREMYGGTGNLDLKIGGAILQNQLILSVDLIQALAENPKVKDNGADLVDVKAALYMGMIGVGATHYFMPGNMFINETIGVGKFVEQMRNQRQTSDAGFAFQFKAGKEWWVSRDWGLGVSVVLFHIGVPNQSNSDGLSESLDGNSLGILFNLTFN
jgi:hypothetical protein